MYRGSDGNANALRQQGNVNKTRWRRLGLCKPRHPRNRTASATKLALSISLAQCCTFALYPLKWLRFLGFAVYGHGGYISASKGGTEIDDYEADLEARSYYFVPEGPKMDRRMI